MNSMTRMLWSYALAAVALVAASSAVSAQTGPPAAPRPAPAARPAPNAAFPLTMAYHMIGMAEQAGASGHIIDAARTHYRSAIDRYGRNDMTGASGEARLAGDLARAALAERPRTMPAGPRDVPAPPTMAPRTAGGPGGMPGGPGRPFDGMGPGGPMMGHRGGFGGHDFGGMRRHEGFDATRLAELLKIETSPEGHQLAQAAVDANAAAQRAALAGNVEEAGRQTRVSGALMGALHDLAALNHPELAHRRATEPIRRMPMPPGAGGRAPG